MVTETPAPAAAPAPAPAGAATPASATALAAAAADGAAEAVNEEPPEPPPPSFPPYPPYAKDPVPPSLADTIVAGRSIRLKHKSGVEKPTISPPAPAKPRGPKANDVRLDKRRWRTYETCLKRHGAVLTDRMAKLAKPKRRTILYLWRDFANDLPAETISRLRSLLDADEPFKPDQAYELFANVKRGKKKKKTGVKDLKRDLLAIGEGKKHTWARNATVAFAKGIQRRLSQPTRFSLSDKMLDLSNVILEEICRNMHMRVPARTSKSQKSRFVMDAADKIAVWIDEILVEADDRLLMMDFDEDEEVENLSTNVIKAVSQIASDSGTTSQRSSITDTKAKVAKDTPKETPKVSPKGTPAGTPNATPALTPASSKASLSGKPSEAKSEPPKPPSK